VTQPFVPPPVPPPSPTPITGKTWLASIAAFSAAWMVVMATRYFALQAADVNGALGVGVDSGSWLSTAYAIAEPIGVVLGAWLGIVFSLRRMLLGGVIVFLAAMCLPLAAPGYGTLMASRILTGLAAGAIMPQCIVIQLQAWGPTRTPIAIALYLSAPTAGALFGGLIGAWGVEQFGWSFLLWASTPLGLLALVAGWVGCRRERCSWRPLVHADVAGFIALCAAIGLFACAVSQGDRMRWLQTPAIPALFAASAACLAIFLLRDWRRIRHPALWVKLYGRWNIALTATGVLSLTLAISLSGVLVPGLLAQVQGFRPEQVAPALWTAFWPQALSYAVCVAIVRRKLCDVRVLVILGFATVAIGALVDLRLTSQWQQGELYLGQLIQGIGLPMIALPLIYQFTGDLRPPAESLPAASVFNLSRVLGGTIATAWANTSLRLGGQAKFAELLSNTGFYPDGQGETLAALAGRFGRLTSDPRLAHAQAVQVVANAARRQAAVLGAASALATLAWLLFASCVLVVLMAEFGWGKALRPHEKRP
jgi:MFS transporter, DHA2 family, multidrug resistance protein